MAGLKANYTAFETMASQMKSDISALTEGKTAVQNAAKAAVAACGGDNDIGTAVSEAIATPTIAKIDEAVEILSKIADELKKVATLYGDANTNLLNKIKGLNGGGNDQAGGNHNAGGGSSGNNFAHTAM